MSEEILVNVTPPETRVAVIENGIAQEIIVERSARRGLVGNIYKGKVCRVLPGMQAAFVEIGLDRAAFLHANDINLRSRDENGQQGNISNLVREGGEIIVQVVKDPLGTKGARLTTNLSIPSVVSIVSLLHKFRTACSWESSSPDQPDGQESWNPLPM